MKYKVTLFISKYVNVGGELQLIEVSRAFSFKDWDDVQNLIGYLVEGADGAVKFEVTQI